MIYDIIKTAESHIFTETYHIIVVICKRYIMLLKPHIYFNKFPLYICFILYVFIILYIVKLKPKYDKTIS